MLRLIQYSNFERYFACLCLSGGLSGSSIPETRTKRELKKASPGSWEILPQAKKDTIIRLIQCAIARATFLTPAVSGSGQREGLLSAESRSYRSTRQSSFQPTRQAVLGSFSTLVKEISCLEQFFCLDHPDQLLRAAPPTWLKRTATLRNNSDTAVTHIFTHKMGTHEGDCARRGNVLRGECIWSGMHSEGNLFGGDHSRMGLHNSAGYKLSGVHMKH